MFRLQVTIIRQTFQYMDMTCSKLYIIECIVVFLTERLLDSLYCFTTLWSTIVFCCPRERMPHLWI